MKYVISCSMVLIFVLGVSCQLQAGIVNGGFEDSTTGWNDDGSTGNYSIGPTSGYGSFTPTEGSIFALLVASQSDAGFSIAELTQDFLVTYGDILMFDCFVEDLVETGVGSDATAFVRIRNADTDSLIKEYAYDGNTSVWMSETYEFQLEVNCRLDLSAVAKVWSIPGSASFVAGFDNIRLVPEPGTITLLICGLLVGLALLRRRR